MSPSTGIGGDVAVYGDQAGAPPDGSGQGVSIAALKPHPLSINTTYSSANESRPLTSGRNLQAEPLAEDNPQGCRTPAEPVTLTPATA